MIERADARIENGSELPADVAARVQSSFAYVVREAGKDAQALGLADRALKWADLSKQPLARLMARQARAEILMRLGRCADALESFRQADGLLAAARRELAKDALAAYMVARANGEARCESKPEAALRRLKDAESIVGLSAVTRANLCNVQAMELARLGRNAEALQAIDAGLAAAQSSPDGAYMRIALLRMRSQVQRRSGDLLAARRSIAAAVALAPGKVNIFEELRLPLLEAGILAELRECPEARKLTEQSLARADQAGAAAWMLHADAAEVYSRCGDCRVAMRENEMVDRMTGGTLANDWRGNRLFFMAECVASTDRTRAARLAREALAVYGELLPENSSRHRRLLELSQVK